LGPLFYLKPFFNSVTVQEHFKMLRTKLESAPDFYSNQIF